MGGWKAYESTPEWFGYQTFCFTIGETLFHCMKKESSFYFSADEKFDGTYQTNVVVSDDGSCLYVPPGLFKSTCIIGTTVLFHIFSWPRAALYLPLSVCQSDMIHNCEWNKTFLLRKYFCRQRQRQNQVRKSESQKVNGATYISDVVFLTFPFR